MHNNIILSGLVAATLIYIVVSIMKIRNDFILVSQYFQYQDGMKCCELGGRGEDCPHLSEEYYWAACFALGRIDGNFWHRHLGAAMGWVDWL